MSLARVRAIAAAALAALFAGCAAQQPTNVMEWLENEYLMDPGRR